MRLILLVLISLSILVPVRVGAQDAKPETGEGAASLLKRNGIDPSKLVLAKFRDLNDGKFTSRGGLRSGVTYRLPINVVDESIFGESYRQVEIVSDDLNGTVWYLIGGHGGQDPGATATYKGRKIYEDEIAYDTMLRFGRLLRQNGATVFFMSQDDDGIRDEVYLAPDTDERNLDGSYVGKGRRKRLKTRTDLINRTARKQGSKYQRVVEFHVDNYSASRQFDVSFFYWSIPGEHLARTLRETLKEKYEEAQPNRGFTGRMRKEPFHTLKSARPVVAYIELGNIRNPVDQERLVQPRNRQTIAKWLYEGFLKDVQAHRRR